MNGTRNRVFTKQLLAGLSVTLCAASYLALDSLNSASFAQTPDRCERTSVVEQWLRQHREVRLVRDDLSSVADAVNKYPDTDFSYDQKSNRDRKEEFRRSVEDAKNNFERLIRAAAYNSTPACRICQLDQVYQDAVLSGEGDVVTVQELEHFRFRGLFSRLAPDWQVLERKKAEMRDLEQREQRDHSREVEVALDDAMRTIDALTTSVEREKDELRNYRQSSEWDRLSPKMVAERTRYVCGGEGPGDRPGERDTRGEQPPPGRPR